MSVEKMFDEINVTNQTVDGKCSRCGECCADFLPLTDQEIAEIKKYVKEHKIQENIKRAPSSSVVIELTCPFYNNKKRVCDIYEVRPSICRVFVCNQSYSEIRKNKSEMFNNIKRRPVSLRKEIYNNSASSDFLFNLLKQP